MSSAPLVYQIHCAFSAQVIVWPEGAALPAELPYGGFARCTPCDGASETPAVPPFLPRPMAKGRYRWGAYLCGDRLIVALDSDERGLPRIASAHEGSVDQLILFAPDGLWYRILQIGLDGVPAASTPRAHHGPRYQARSLPDWEWSVCREEIAPARARTLWSLAVSDLAPLLRDDCLCLSLSRSSTATLECVAWGAYGIWAPRFDESGTLHLRPVSPPPAPQLEELLMEWDGYTSATFSPRWSHPYGSDEFIPGHPNEKWRAESWSHFSLRLNRKMEQAAFGSPSALPSYPLQPGGNELHLATRGGTALRKFVEIFPGELCLPPDLIALTAYDHAPPPGVDRWVADCFGAFIEATPAPWMKYESWMGRIGAALSLYGLRTPISREWQEWLDELLRFTLRLQRADGSFSGFHLAPGGVSDRPWQGGAYDAGMVGEFWLRYHELTGCPESLAASARLVVAYRDYRVELNPNFAAFAAFHLAPHFALTGDSLAREHLIYYLECCVLRDLLPHGFHGGHNHYSVYSNIILRALALGYELLGEHPLSQRLKPAIARMSNQLLSRLQDDGRIDSRDRHFVGERLWADGLFAVAAARFEAKALAPFLHFMQRQAMAQSRAGAPAAVSFTSPASLALSPAQLTARG